MSGPGSSVIAGDGEGGVHPVSGVTRIREEQNASSSATFVDVRESTKDLAIVGGIHEVIDQGHHSPRFPTIMGISHLAVSGTIGVARIEHENSVGKLDDLVLIHHLAHGFPGLPRDPVIVGVNGLSLLSCGIAHCHLRDEASLVTAVEDGDPLS